MRFYLFYSKIAALDECHTFPTFTSFYWVGKITMTVMGTAITKDIGSAEVPSAVDFYKYCPLSNIITIKLSF